MGRFPSGKSTGKEALFYKKRGHQEVLENTEFTEFSSVRTPELFGIRQKGRVQKEIEET